MSAFKSLFPVEKDEHEYRGYMIETRDEGNCWVAYWGRPYRSTRHDDYPGCFLRGPFRSQEAAFKAATRSIDKHLLVSKQRAAGL